MRLCSYKGILTGLQAGHILWILGNEQRNESQKYVQMKFEYANVKYGSIIFKNQKVTAFYKCYRFLDTLYLFFHASTFTNFSSCPGGREV